MIEDLLYIFPFFGKHYIMWMVIIMNKEIKRQLILSGILLCLLVSTLIFGYDNFHFHTYIPVDDYQYAFEVKNDVIKIENYEFSKHNQKMAYGGARILPLQDNFYMKDDILKIKVNIKDQSFDYQYEIKDHNEVVVMPYLDGDFQFQEDDLKNVQLDLTIERDQKDIYHQTFDMKQEDVYMYSGSNKDYLIQNVYVSDHWLKTGDLSSKIDDIEKKYQTITIDYLYLKDNGDKENLNDYERFIHIQGKTNDVLSGKLNQTQFYDGQGSLLEKTFVCVVTLDDGKPFVFKLPLHAQKKVVDEHDQN